MQRPGAKNTVRGSWVSSGASTYETERMTSAPRRLVVYTCWQGHQTGPLAFAATAPPPARWVCRVCSADAGPDPLDPPPPPMMRLPRHKDEVSHWGHIRARRDEADLDRLLAEMLDRLHHSGS